MAEYSLRPLNRPRCFLLGDSLGFLAISIAKGLRMAQYRR